jgi:hypothetical protein
MRGARHVHAVSFWIDGNVVPASAALKRDFFEDFEFAAVLTGA